MGMRNSVLLLAVGLLLYLSSLSRVGLWLLWNAEFSLFTVKQAKFIVVEAVAYTNKNPLVTSNTAHTGPSTWIHIRRDCHRRPQHDLSMHHNQ
jgi:hypothetical protein